MMKNIKELEKRIEQKRQALNRSSNGCSLESESLLKMSRDLDDLIVQHMQWLQEKPKKPTT